MMSRGFDQLAKRWGYVDFLAATMRNVPARLPFEDGAKVGATIMHVLQPRFIFPDKPPLPSDSDVTQKYTGIHYGRSSSEGTSVSLGYLAELYIDFGILGTLVAMFILGVLLSLCVRFVCSSSSLPTIVSHGLAVMLVMSVIMFDQALAKTVGAFVTTVAVIVVLRRFLFPFLLSMLGQSNKIDFWHDFHLPASLPAVNSTLRNSG
jgi:hypothetical protein